MTERTLATEAQTNSYGVLREMAFDALVKMTAKHVGDQGFFGDSAELASKIYRKSLIGQSFPNFWMEVPLAGNPGFDLHVYYDRGQVSPEDRFAPGCGFGMQALFDWYFGVETSGVGVGFAHDLRDGNVATGAYVNFNRHPLTDTRGFFTSLGAEGSFEQATALMDRLPNAWNPWYLGLFPERPGAGVRVGSFVSKMRQRDYVCDWHELEQDLLQAGFTAFDETMLERVSEMAALPFTLELQLDATEEGTGDTLGVDLTLRLGVSSADRIQAAFADGPGARACELLESWGTIDGRWHKIGDAALANIVPMSYADKPVMLLMTCGPAFIKVKWTQGQPQPGKVYLECAARPL